MKPTLTIPLEIKSLNKREFEGHGSIFGNEDLGGDVVQRGAFATSLLEHDQKNSMPQMFWMHDASRVPGKWTEMSEDNNGLYVKGVLAETPLGDEIHELLKMEAVRGLSIGYMTRDSEWTDDGTRVLKEIDLWEVSVVSLPMNPLAQVTMAKSQLSSAGEYVPTARQFERTLRDVGCSQTVAKKIIARVYEGKARDVPPDDDDEAREVLAIVEAMEDEFEAATINHALKGVMT